MSLLNLLTVGNSFSTVEDHPSRYKWRPENQLPQFGSALPEDGSAAAHPDHCADQSPPAELFPADPPAAARLDPRPEELPDRPPDPLKRDPMMAYPQGRWSIRKTLLQAGSPKPAAPVEPIQAELPWEDIPVMRNDLSEADLEVVRATPAVARAARETAGSSGADETPRLLNRITARLFRTGGK